MNQPHGQRRSQHLGSTFRHTAIASALCVLVGNAAALELQTGNEDVQIRWDNTVKYSAAFRQKSADPRLLTNPNTDDGDRNFGKGQISSRFDLFTEMDLIYKKDFGLRLSAAAWNDSKYLGGNNNPGFVGGAFPNQTSVAASQFTQGTKDVHGRGAEWLDGFVFGKFDLDGKDATVRAGRHSLLWGESLFFGANAIAGGQMPVDIVKLVSVPNTQFKEAIRPVPMVSGQVVLSPGLSVGAYLQTASSKHRTPAAGSYFSNVDLGVDGAENLLLGPGLYAPRGADMNAKNSGQGGLQLKLRDGDVDYGFYAIQFHSKLPQLVPRVAFVPGPGVIPTSYYLAYHENIKAFGASVSKTYGDYNVAAEFSVRRNQDLASTQGADASALGAAPTTNNNRNPGYAIGNTQHLNVSVFGSVPKTALWREATLLAELAWNQVTSITKNAAAADPNATKSGVALRTVFEPTYRGVASGLDIGIPIGVGYAPKNSRPLAMHPNAWVPAGGGDVSIGLNGSYLDAWRFSLTYTHYYGPASTFTTGANNAYGWGQTLKDRDFIALSVRTSF